MNNNATNVKPAMAPQAATASQPVANKANVACGCNDHGAKHQGHSSKNGKR